ncbi:unnamed protein product [Arctia plantaginis]|uniref:Gustatory receptor n=1 Tax=Arctia plantaginis TaxID=874455 RepID=A0A8S0Z0D4_ARCPL|nr:unnamed protein product [Arctia plantaginis]
MDLTPLRTECVVSGTLFFILQISRLAGTSPVEFERGDDGWRVRVSMFYYVYGCVVQVILAVCIGIYSIDREEVVDGYEASHNTGFMRIILIIYFVVHVMSGAAIAFTGLDRMRHMIDCKARLQWINAEIDGFLRPSKSNERTMFLIVIATLVFGYYAVSFEYGVYFSDLITAHVTVSQFDVNQHKESNEGNSIPNHVISCGIDSLPVIVRQVRMNTAAPIARSLSLLAWSLLCVGTLAMAVDACHRSHIQLWMTETLIRQMRRHTHREAAEVSDKLKLFYRHIQLNPVCFAPLNLMTFNRNILIMVLSSIITYLTVVINL